MDANVSARFFRVSEAEPPAADLPDALLAEAKKPIAQRERDVTGTGHLLRIEDCASDGDFVVGELCRKQTTNIPPQAGPGGLSPITLPNGQGIGHVAAFRYHRPTRVILLQNNIYCVTHHRLAIYLQMVTGGGSLHSLTPVLREDALDRFKNRNIRSFTVRFASPENLEALDDRGIASAKGARLLAEAFHGLDLTITVGVGKRRKKFLDFGRVSKEVKALLGSDADIKQLEISATEDEEGTDIDFLQEQLKCKETLDLPEGNHKKNYQVRRAFLKAEFGARLDYLNKHFAKPNKKAGS